MKKLALNKETVRNLDENALDKIHAGKGATVGRTTCGWVSACPNYAC